MIVNSIYVTINNTNAIEDQEDLAGKTPNRMDGYNACVLQVYRLHVRYRHTHRLCVPHDACARA